MSCFIGTTHVLRACGLVPLHAAARPYLKWPAADPSMAVLLDVCLLLLQLDASTGCCVMRE